MHSSKQNEIQNWVQQSELQHLPQQSELQRCMSDFDKTLNTFTSTLLARQSFLSMQSLDSVQNHLSEIEKIYGDLLELERNTIFQDIANNLIDEEDFRVAQEILLKASQQENEMQEVININDRLESSCREIINQCEKVEHSVTLETFCEKSNDCISKFFAIQLNINEAVDKIVERKKQEQTKEEGKVSEKFTENKTFSGSKLKERRNASSLKKISESFKNADEDEISKIDDSNAPLDESMSSASAPNLSPDLEDEIEGAAYSEVTKASEESKDSQEIVNSLVEDTTLSKDFLPKMSAKGK